MKKTLLSVLAGLIVIGSASAVPGPDDRKALCDRHPLTMHWVENTQACIPINPCTSDNVQIRDGYCIRKSLPRDNKMRDLILDRYIKNVLHDSMENVRIGYLGQDYIALNLSDGGYYVLLADKDDIRLEIPGYAYWAYGLAYDDSMCDEFHGIPKVFCDNHALVAHGVVEQEDICHDVADFASLLADRLLESMYIAKDKTCIIFYE